MRDIHKPSTLTALTAVLLAGCAGASERYPSLQIRESERLSGEFVPAQSASPAEIAPVDPDGIRSALASAQMSYQEFVELAPTAKSLARAAGSDVESNDYARALLALARLDVLRGQTVGALAQLDAIEAQAAATFAPVEDVKAAQLEVTRLVAEQQQAIEALDLALTR